jgi:hypothetical protein
MKTWQNLKNDQKIDQIKLSAAQRQVRKTFRTVKRRWKDKRVKRTGIMFPCVRKRKELGTGNHFKRDGTTRCTSAIPTAIIQLFLTRRPPIQNFEG